MCITTLVTVIKLLISLFTLTQFLSLQERAVLSAMRQLLKVAKEKRAKLQENLETFQKIHEVYMKVMSGKQF